MEGVITSARFSRNGQRCEDELYFGILTQVDSYRVICKHFRMLVTSDNETDEPIPFPQLQMKWLKACVKKKFIIL